MEVRNQHCPLFTNCGTMELLHDSLGCSLILAVQPRVVELLVRRLERYLHRSTHTAQTMRELVLTEVLWDVAHLNSHTRGCRY